MSVVVSHKRGRESIYGTDIIAVVAVAVVSGSIHKMGMRECVCQCAGEAIHL